MKREKFLSESWRRYPAAESDWLDVSEFLREPSAARAKVCGRLQISDRGSAGRLFAAGQLVEVEFAVDCTWFDSCEGAFTVEVLQTGDLLCAEVERVGARLIVRRCRLLAPANKQFHLSSGFSFARSRQWELFLREVRGYFREQSFVEMQTPTLVPSPGTEPFLDPFVTSWQTPSNERRLFLPTSPEFHLKKLLAAGWTRIFELKPCFRNGEEGAHHQPEFLMLEWYRGYSTLERVADDVAGLLTWLSERLPDLPGRPAPLVRTSMRELFRLAFDGFELRPETSLGELVELATRHEVRTEFTDSWDEVFFRLFLEKIEGSLPGLLATEGPVLIHGYPPSQAALARIGADGFADRFEVYWRGLELANAFHELNDVMENQARFADDAAQKAALGKPAVPVDQGLVEALEFGMPPSGGIALGVERLFMAFYNLEKIADLRPFPFSGE